MQQNNEIVTTDEQYLAALEKANLYCDQFEAGSLSQIQVREKLREIYYQVRPYEQTKLEKLIANTRKGLQPFMVHFYKNPFELDEKALFNMTAQAMLFMEHTLSEWNVFSPVILKPSDADFLLTLTIYLADLGSRMQLSGDPQAAITLAEFTANILVPFITQNVFTVTFDAKSKSKSQLTAVKLDMRTLGEYIMQQYTMILFRHQAFEKGRTYLESLTEYNRWAKNCRDFIYKDTTKYFTEHSRSYRDDLKNDRSLFKKHLANIKKITGDKYLVATQCFRYHLWAWSMLSLAEPQLKLALCYLNLALDQFDRLNAINVPLKIYEHYREIAAKYVGARQYAAAVNVYKTLLNRFDNVLKSIPEFASDYNRMCATLQKLKQHAFLQLQEQWKNVGTQDLPCSILFDDKHQRLVITHTDKNWLLALRKALYKLDTDFHFDAKECQMFLSDACELTFLDIKNLLEQAQRLFLNRQLALEQRDRALKNKIVAEPEPDSPEIDDDYLPYDPCLFSSSPARFTRVRVRKAVTLPVTKERVLVKKVVKEINWGKDWPRFHETQGIVYPIPNPSCKNSSLPHDIFYGYLDEESLFDIEPELLKQFEEQLARGKIVSKGDAHGLRSITKEVPADSLYLFKINLHAEDVRIYGRKVADRTTDGKAKILIAFDQAVRHDQTLQLVDEHANSKKLSH